MLTKRRVRFSIAAMLVVMTGTAVLLNHEARRAKAIELTVKRIEQWNGMLNFRTRPGMPVWLANVLPQYWSQEIDVIFVKLYTKDFPNLWDPRDVTVIEPRELKEVVDLGALDNLISGGIWGSAVRYDVASRLCKSPSIENFAFHDAVLSHSEVQALMHSYPKCKFFIKFHENVVR